MFLLLGAFIAGMLTILAPCVLPLLPIIIGGSVSGDTRNFKRPIIITVSLAFSLVAFTLLLKVSTVLIGIPPESINYISGTIIILLGIGILFPLLYEKLTIKLGFHSRSQKMMAKGGEQKNPVVASIITGAALGPVFSSCSPVYAYILATVLPANFSLAMSYIGAYVLGLSFILLLVSIFSQRFISKVRWAVNPKGAFQRSLAIVFILVGILIFTGSAQGVQTWVSRHTPFDFDSLSAKLIPNDSGRESQKGIYNVKAYEAPEFVGLENWINSDNLSVKNDLKGKVVLVDFWTYSCINCIRTQPYLRGWHKTYKDDGLVVVGVHAPEFAFEKLPANVKKAVEKAKLEYPIALDNDFSTWNAFKNQYWPASYLIDKDGKVRRVHFGEGEYKETEEAIRGLLKERNGSDPGKSSVSGNGKVPVGEKQTPETYLGTKRAGNYVGDTRLLSGKTQTFVSRKDLKSDQWTLSGVWEVTSEKIIARGAGPSTLTIKTSAKDVYFVAGSNSEESIAVLLDGKPISTTNSAGSDVNNSKVKIKSSQLYRLVAHPRFVPNSIVTLQVPSGVEINAFTFGS